MSARGSETGWAPKFRAESVALVIERIGRRFWVPEIAHALRFKAARLARDLETRANLWKQGFAYELDAIGAAIDGDRYAEAEALLEWVRHASRLGSDGDVQHYSSLLDFSSRLCATGDETAEDAEIEALEARCATLEAENKRMRGVLRLASDLGRAAEG